MSTELIAAMASINATGTAAAVIAPPTFMPPGQMPGAATPATAPFGALISQGLDGLNKELMVSQADLQQLAVGNAPNLHQIMMRLEESRLSFQMLMQVRNRVLEAYQDVMKMQI